MKLTGTIEVFKNKNGYLTGVLKSFDEDNKKVLGKAYIDVKLPEEVEVKDGQTLSLDVKEGYLNAVYVDVKDAFTKLKINVVKCDVKAVFPEEKKAKKTSKKEGK